MASILILSGGGESVDFIAGSEFSVVRDGLDLPSPEMSRVMAGGPPLREGSSLVTRRYDNREIGITFHADRQSNDSLQAAISKLHRIVNYAVKAQASHGLLTGATLQVKMENQTDTVTFDILDGEVKIGGPLQQLVRGEGPLLDNELILTALPYGRGSIVRLENHLVNPFFDINPLEEGRDAGHYMTFGTSGDRLERAVTGLFPANEISFMASVLCYPTDETGFPTQSIIGISGSGGVTWEIIYHPNGDQFIFQMQGSVTSINASTIGKAFPHNNWYEVTVLALDTKGATANKILMVFVNGELAGYLNHTEIQLATPASDAKFHIGARFNDTFRFSGRVAGAAVILRNIWPWQQKMLFKYGLRSLIRGDATIPGHSYWDLADGEYGAVWPFDESDGTQLDDGPGGRNLTKIGTPVTTQNLRLPEGWVVSHDLSASRFLEIAASNQKYGRFAVHFQKSATGANEPTIKQTVPIPVHKRLSGANRDWELFFWVISDGVNDKLRLKITGSPSATSHFDADVTIPSTLTLFGVKFTNDADDTAFDIEVGQTVSGTLLDAHLANIMLVPGTPFGMTTTPTAVTKQIPFISGIGLIGDEDSQEVVGRSRQLRVYNLPGDHIATRVFVENPSV